MQAHKQKIKVLIADDHAILLTSLNMLIDSQIDMEVVSAASDAEKAVQSAQETKPDVAVLDLNMPGGGMNALRQIAKNHRDIRVLIFTMHDEPEYLKSALDAGASGYLLKRAADMELISAIRAVHRGGVYVDPRMPNVFV